MYGKGRKNPLIECACGCGHLRPKYNKSGEQRKFIHGHQNRGRKLSEETRGKMRKRTFSEEHRRKISESKKGEKNPMFNKHHTEEAKKKIAKNHYDNSGDKNPNYGKSPSEETRRKMSESRKGKRLSIETRKKISLVHKNRSPETRKKLSDANKGKKIPEETKKKMSAAKKGKPPWNKGKTGIYSSETCNKFSEINKRRWKDPTFIKKIMIGWNAKPNRVEKMVDQILQEIYPNEWKYNGDFSCGITIGGLIPDFVNVNGKKIVLEIFGDVWHDTENTFLNKIDWKRTEFGRKAIYSQYGYECIILWEHDLKNKTDVHNFIINTLSTIHQI